MKRIEFIAPVEAMRGNLSGAQKLEYPTDNLGASEGPMGSVNYARNYSPRFVGAKIAKSGKKYFSVRLRSANHLTSKSKKAMALLGGTGAIYAAILKSASLLAGIQAQYNALTEIGMQMSFRKYVTGIIRSGLMSHKDLFTFAGPASLVQVDNPWVRSAASLNIQVSQAILVKFWDELAPNGIYFSIDGATGVAHYPQTFADVIGSTFNVLNLSIADGKVKQGNLWIKSRDTDDDSDPGSYVLENNTVVPNTGTIVYETTDVAPGA